MFAFDKIKNKNKKELVEMNEVKKCTDMPLAGWQDLIGIHYQVAVDRLVERRYFDGCS